MEGIDETTTTTITTEDSAENENNYDRTEVEQSQNSFRSEKDGESSKKYKINVTAPVIKIYWSLLGEKTRT